MVRQESAGATDVARPFESGIAWRGGALAGFVASVVTGATIAVIDLSTLELAIAGLYGFRGSFVVGWLAHLTHGTLFGVVFAAVLSDPTLHRVADHRPKSVLAGVVFGLVLAVAGAGIIMPIWLAAVGVSAPPSIPYLTVPMLGWHVVYGVVVGGALPALSEP